MSQSIQEYAAKVAQINREHQKALKKAEKKRQAAIKAALEKMHKKK